MKYIISFFVWPLILLAWCIVPIKMALSFIWWEAEATEEKVIEYFRNQWSSEASNIYCDCNLSTSTTYGCTDYCNQCKRPKDNE